MKPFYRKIVLTTILLVLYFDSSKAASSPIPDVPVCYMEIRGQLIDLTKLCGQAQRVGVAQLLETKQCSRCDLHGSDLRNHDLSNADLQGADLSDVTLTGSSLSGANLAGANLSGTDLTGVNLRGTIMPDGTIPYPPKSLEIPDSLRPIEPGFKK